jgi:hypothetical protein
MKTLNLYRVEYATISGAERSFNIAAPTKAAAKRQTRDYSKTITKVTGVERLGNVNIPVALRSGL